MSSREKLLITDQYLTDNRHTLILPYIIIKIGVLAVEFEQAHYIVLGSAFVIALVLGAIANKTNFCTMGAVSDLINIGDSGRFRAWLLAIAVAILGVSLLEWTGIINLAPDITRPAYRTSNLMWPRYLLGGLLFGIGMTLASGCGNKTLIRIGGGNLKSVVVLVMIGIFAWAMNRTNFNANVFLPWMTPLYLNLTEFQMRTQDLGGIILPLLGLNEMENVDAVYQNLKLILGIGIGGFLLAIVFKAAAFRRSFDNVLGGLAVGSAVVAAWYVTAGPVGQLWMDEWLMLNVQPEAVKAQSLTFVDPAGQALYYIMSGAKFSLLTFGLVSAIGVIAGSFIWAVLSSSFRFEWFSSTRDFVQHVIGGSLMGIGGIMAFGCTIGQAVTGVSTLALGSLLTFIAIIFGSALTMKIQLYKMIYEQASLLDIFTTALVDLRLLPKGLRKLEAV